jgi:peptide chain release factor 2
MQYLQKERARLVDTLSPFVSSDEELHYLDESSSVLDEEEGAMFLEDISKGIENLEKKINDLEVRLLLSGPHDPGNAILTINPGAGGTESQDWAQMLMRMYLRWAEGQGFKTEIIDLQPADEAGIKTVTISVEGLYAFGYLKEEAGVHRLVRISPFDTNKRRHTSFTAVLVYPEIEEDIDIEIRDEDLRVDTFRASGAGGQHVNKTSSAVRITHLPTGIVVSSQSDRSQHRNREVAMKILKSRLYDLEIKEKEKEMEGMVGEKKEIAWGSQIRSYVLHPYQMVKDHRTNVEVGNVNSVLDGSIDLFISASLNNKKQKSKAGK